MDSAGEGTHAGPAYDLEYHALAQLNYDQEQYDVLYSKYMEHKTMEGEMESRTRRGPIRFTTVRKPLRPMIERYPTIHQRITELLEEETQVNLDSVLLYLRQLQYFETYPPSFGRGEVAPAFSSCITPVDLADGDPLEVAVMESIPKSEALTDVEVIEVENFIINLNLVVIKPEGRKRQRTDAGHPAPTLGAHAQFSSMSCSEPRVEYLRRNSAPLERRVHAPRTGPSRK